MKTLLLILVGFTNAEIAQECAPVSETAETVMISRQAGTPMSENMGRVEAMPDGYDRTIAEYIVLAAYRKPRFENRDLQAMVIADFRDEMMMFCFNALKYGDTQ